MKIATWNINSIKVRLPAVTQYIQETSPDVLALQETKSQDENFPKAEIEKLGYSCVFTGQKTYNGVALIFKKTLSDINLNPIKTPENEKRSIAAVFDKTLILNLYVVNGQDVGTDKYQYKLRWLQTVFDYLKEATKKYKNIIVLGDFNIAPTDADVFDVEATRDQILCSSKERAFLGKFKTLGLNDLFTQFDYPEKTFSWWDYRGGAFHKNIGYRIDLILGSENIAKKCKEVYIDKHTRHKSWCKNEPRTSDHAPVVAIVDKEKP